MTETMMNPHACLAGECVSRCPATECDPPAACAVAATLKALKGAPGGALSFAAFARHGSGNPIVDALSRENLVEWDRWPMDVLRARLTDKGRAA